MKKIISLILIVSTSAANAQARKVAKMAPVFSPGYFVNVKGDTVRGQIQTNPDSETKFYTEFFFLPPKSKKPKAFNSSSRIRAYGFDNRNFAAVSYEGRKLFLERLATGRLRFYEFRFNGKVDGYPGIESMYFIKDTGAEGEDADLQVIRKISTKYYKKNLKPYMKDQPMIWSDLDKYEFDEKKVVNAVKEFNRYYASVAN